MRRLERCAIVGRHAGRNASIASSIARELRAQGSEEVKRSGWLIAPEDIPCRTRGPSARVCGEPSAHSYDFPPTRNAPSRPRSFVRLSGPESQPGEAQ
eukprot:6550257-Pyramimonas_sp.AAC.3